MKFLAAQSKSWNTQHFSSSTSYFPSVLFSFPFLVRKENLVDPPTTTINHGGWVTNELIADQGKPIKSTTAVTTTTTTSAFMPGAGSSSQNSNDADATTSRCAVPDLSHIKCAPGFPVRCTGNNNVACLYDMPCYAAAAGYDVIQHCVDWSASP
jgi:hypothetical protein